MASCRGIPGNCPSVTLSVCNSNSGQASTTPSSLGECRPFVGRVMQSYHGFVQVKTNAHVVPALILLFSVWYQLQHVRHSVLFFPLVFPISKVLKMFVYQDIKRLICIAVYLRKLASPSSCTLIPKNYWFYANNLSNMEKCIQTFIETLRSVA